MATRSRNVRRLCSDYRWASCRNERSKASRTRSGVTRASPEANAWATSIRSKGSCRNNSGKWTGASPSRGALDSGRSAAREVSAARSSDPSHSASSECPAAAACRVVANGSKARILEPFVTSHQLPQCRTTLLGRQRKTPLLLQGSLGCARRDLNPRPIDP